MEDSQIFFSIIVPVYNVEAYIEDCLNSVLNQTFKNFELIIVNDGSSDNSMNIINDLTENETHVIIVNQINAGASSARNAGILHAKGDYIYFMDSDDIIALDMLEHLYKIILTETMPDVISFNAKSFSSNIYEDADVKVLAYDKYYSRPYLQTGMYNSFEYYSEMHKRNNFVVSPCLYVTKASVIHQHKLKFFVGIIHEDELFTRQLLLEARRVYYQKANYYQRRVRPGSVTQSGASRHKIISLIKVADELLSLYEKKGISMLQSDAYKFYRSALRLIDASSEKSEKQRVKTLYYRRLYNFFDLSKFIIIRNKVLRNIIFKSYFKTL